MSACGVVVSHHLVWLESADPYFAEYQIERSVDSEEWEPVATIGDRGRVSFTDYEAPTGLSVRYRVLEARAEPQVES